MDQNPTQSSPNSLGAATAEPQNVSQGLEAQLQAALAARPGRNRRPVETATQVAGSTEPATAPETPVAPEQPESTEQTIDSTTEPLVESPADSVSDIQDVVNFLDFAKDNPKAKIRIPNKNTETGYVELTAEKAAAILGQGSAIHEEQRQFKAREAEFKEYEAKRKQELDGLQIAMDFTIAPQLKAAYDEIVKTQGYQATFQKMLAEATDESDRIKIQASIDQNERYIREQSDFIKTNRPQVEQFRQFRAKEVQNILNETRQSFSDKELKNEYHYNELRERVSKDWKQANDELIPGVRNIDLVSSDEHILSLIRDGLKYRQGPKNIQNTGSSIAAATAGQRRQTSPQPAKTQDLQERARSGDKTATRDLLSAYLIQQKSNRKVN